VAINEMLARTLLQPAVLVDAATTLVHKVASIGLEQVRHHWALATRTTWASFAALLLVCSIAIGGVFLEVKVTEEVMRVEVESFNAVWSRNLTTLIDFFLVEHLSFSMALDDVTVSISEVPALVRWLAINVNTVSLRICEDNNVTFLITLKISEDIVLVEISGIVVWRALDCWVTVLELHKRLLRHVESLGKSLISNCRLNIEVKLLGRRRLVLSCFLGRIEVCCLLTFSFGTKSSSFCIIFILLVSCFLCSSGGFFSILASLLVILALKFLLLALEFLQLCILLSLKSRSLLSSFSSEFICVLLVSLALSLLLFSNFLAFSIVSSCSHCRFFLFFALFLFTSASLGFGFLSCFTLFLCHSSLFSLFCDEGIVTCLHFLLFSDTLSFLSCLFLFAGLCIIF
jgi:hypothetical protein